MCSGSHVFEGDESLVEYVSLPAGAQATDLSFYAEEKRKAWVAVSCTDGAVRLIDASPERTASVVRTSYSHGVAATAVAISGNGNQVASGSSSGHVVLQPFHGSGPTPLPGANLERERETEERKTFHANCNQVSWSPQSRRSRAFATHHCVRTIRIKGRIGWRG